MGLSYTSRDSGLVVAHQGADFAAVQAALRQHDRDLRLVPQGIGRNGKTLYNVYRWYGPDRRAEFILAWMDENMNALPLSSALIDEVQRHDKNCRGTIIGADEHNRRLIEQTRKDGREETREIAREYGERIDGKRNTILPRSQSLRRARDKLRNKQPYPELRP